MLCLLPQTQGQSNGSKNTCLVAGKGASKAPLPTCKYYLKIGDSPEKPAN